MTDPILIAGNPRSGTSMTAGLIARHGVQVGEQRGANAGNPKGGYENKPISDHLKAILRWSGHGINPCEGTMPGALCEVPDFANQMRRHIPDPDAPWLYKNFRILPTWALWAKHFPKARYVLPIRNRADTLASMVAHHHIGTQGAPDELDAWITWSWERQVLIAESAPFFWFHVDRAWAGDIEHIRDMLAFCGLVMREDVVSDWIDPALWHNRGGVAA